MDKDTHGERDHDAAARDFSISPAQLLTRHAVLIPIQRTDPTRREVKLRLLATGHFPATSLAGAGEAAAGGGWGWGSGRGGWRTGRRGRGGGASPLAPVPRRAAFRFR